MEKSFFKIKPLSLLWQFYLIGFIGHLFTITRPLMLWLTPWFLLMMGILLLFQLYQNFPKKILIWLAFVYLNTLAAEIIGVHTGKIFGVYHYGQTLGLKLMDVPLVIGLNWALIVSAGLALSMHITRVPIFQLLLTGFFAVAIDYFIEPVAIQLDYWHWASPSIPLQNYLAWFLLATLNAGFFLMLKISFTPILFRFFYAVQFGFFLLLNILFRFFA